MTVRSQIDDIRQRDLNLLVVLRVLLETSSVTKSADVLDVTQSAVSKALERLRAEFHDPLLVRTSNRMFLTERAKTLAPLLDAAFDRIEQIFDSTAAFDPKGVDRVVTVGTNEYMQVTLGQALVLRLREEAPSVRVIFRPIASNLPALLAEGSLDMALGIDTHESRGLRSRVIYEDEIVCVAGQESFEPRRLSLPELVSWPQIDISPSGLGTFPRIIEQQLLRNGETRNVVAMLSSYFVLPELLGTLGAVALIPRHVLNGSRLGSILREVELAFAPPRFEMRLYWHNVTNGDPFNAWLRELIATLAGDLGPKD